MRHGLRGSVASEEPGHAMSAGAGWPRGQGAGMVPAAPGFLSFSCSAVSFRCLRRLFFFCELHPSFWPAEQHVGSRGSAVPAMLLSDRKGTAGPAAPSRIRMAADESQGEQTKPEPETAFSPSKSCRQSSRSFLAAPKWFN